MTPDEAIAVLLDAVQDDCQDQWIDIHGQGCLKLLREMGQRAPRAITAVANLMATHSENYVKLNCVELLTHAHMPEAGEALVEALDLPLDDEVLEQIFEDAKDSLQMRTHAQFIAKARALYTRWPNSSLQDFLKSVK
ncbi:hypothetical protein [Paludisphaera rhizosphaerae]|uniref:hypothetical protein n=1 Tax=Paludisphaera rhizosphaerae TaxID=2711216 RepID=UPI0013EB01EA|nr:hypothetical protein [Paludisphaera rhizosphaerae]